jgi:Raf kinase inhibitor-like YbhB/YbcL family protein
MTPFTLHSPAFAPEAPIPARFTCEGDNLSPPLEWNGAPAGARSFVLIVDDPDAPDPAAPRQVWVHWLRYNIPATQHRLGEGEGNTAPNTGQDAVTDSGTSGYHGPCPPLGRHRYFFRLFALDSELPRLGAGAGRAELERAMEGHILASALLMGTYAKTN